MTNPERVNRALTLGIAFFVVAVVAFKLGYRGKKPFETATSWTDIAAATPGLLVLSALVAWAVYFWLGRPRQ